MKVLIVHNRYQQAGGEDVVVESETRLLREAGHDVTLLEKDNASIQGITGKLRVWATTHYSPAGRQEVAAAIDELRPDVVHVHNFFPLLTPSIYDACVDADVPVVQTLHNFRLICAGANLLRDGKVCELCVTGSPYIGALHGCYRDSRIGSLAVSRMIDYHRRHETWNNKVNCFIALTGFARDKFVSAGFPAERIVVKPNFARPDATATAPRANFALYCGRLSQEKGIDVLLQAWELLGTGVPLVVAGDGPMAPELERALAQNPSISWLGHVGRDRVNELMHEASCLVIPSIWYEGFPMSVVEAFSSGLPVVASNLGSLGSIVRDGFNGLVFPAGNGRALADTLTRFFADAALQSQLGEGARADFTENYTAEKNLDQLEAVYSRVLEPARNSPG